MSATSLVGVFSQISQQREELLRLTDEQPHRREEVDDTHRHTPRLCWSNDRDDREVAAKERARLGHDQVGLQVLATRAEIGKH